VSVPTGAPWAIPVKVKPSRCDSEHALVNIQ